MHTQIIQYIEEKLSQQVKKANELAKDLTSDVYDKKLILLLTKLIIKW